jgi:phage terminase large subunit-like protein
MDRKSKLEYLKLLEEKERRVRTRKLYTYYPDKGALRRELYVKHLQYFEAGKKYRERLMLAANRIGKTEGVGGYELALHLTGLYPEWWTGRRFDRPVTTWAAGDTGKTVREIIQMKLLGPPHAEGTGLIPQAHIIDTTAKAGVPDGVDTVYVRHVSGGISQCVLKSYDQKRISFQGTEQDVIWLDEEPPLDVYTECLMRTMTNDGMVMLTFTPLQGMSETVLAFLPGGEILERQEGSKFVLMATWDDAPHLSERQKKELWESIRPFSAMPGQREFLSLAPAPFTQSRKQTLSCPILRFPSIGRAAMEWTSVGTVPRPVFGRVIRKATFFTATATTTAARLSPSCTLRRSNRAAHGSPA